MPLEHHILTKIKAYFDPYITTTVSDWMHLEKYLRIEEYTKRYIIKKAGTAESQLRFILKGGGAVLVIFNKKEICMDICLENDFITDLNSLISGEKSDIFIKTFEEMEVVFLERKHLLRFYEISPACSTLGRILAEQKAYKAQQIQMVHMGSLEQRYDRLMASTPDLLLRAPHRYVASYLRTSPQSLSRLRGRRGGGTAPKNKQPKSK